MERVSIDHLLRIQTPKPDVLGSNSSSATYQKHNLAQVASFIWAFVSSSLRIFSVPIHKFVIEIRQQCNDHKKCLQSKI